MHGTGALWWLALGMAAARAVFGADALAAPGACGDAAKVQVAYDPAVPRHIAAAVNEELGLLSGLATVHQVREVFRNPGAGRAVVVVRVWRRQDEVRAVVATHGCGSASRAVHLAAPLDGVSTTFALRIAEAVRALLTHRASPQVAPPRADGARPTDRARPPSGSRRPDRPALGGVEGSGGIGWWVVARQIFARVAADGWIALTPRLAVWVGGALDVPGSDREAAGYRVRMGRAQLMGGLLVAVVNRPRWRWHMRSGVGAAWVWTAGRGTPVDAADTDRLAALSAHAEWEARLGRAAVLARLGGVWMQPRITVHVPGKSVDFGAVVLDAGMGVGWRW